MGEYAAFLLILVFGFACGYGACRAREPRQSFTLPDVDKIRIEEGDTAILRYKGFLTGEQRRALQRMMEDRFKGQARKVIVLEAGLEVEVVKPAFEIKTGEGVSVNVTGILDGEDSGRRRDDNRAQRAPEEPWS